MVRSLWGALLLGAMLVWGFGAGESSAQSMKKRSKDTVELDGFKATGFDYWKADKLDKEKDKGVLYRFTLAKPKGEPDDGVLLFKEADKGTADEAIIDGEKRLIDAEKRQPVVSEIKKAGPKVTQVFQRGTYLGEDGKAKKNNYRMYSYIVDTGNKKYVVRIIGPTGLAGLVQPDVGTFFKDMKK
jgi:hypothetical protein